MNLDELYNIGDNEFDVDVLLARFRGAMHRINQYKDMYDEHTLENMRLVYELLRKGLMKDSEEEYNRMYEYVSGKFPDAFDIFMDYALESNVSEDSDNEQNTNQFWKKMRTAEAVGDDPRAVVNDTVEFCLNEYFGGKAWFKGGSYAYLMDISKPNQMVASDGSVVKIASFADGIRDYADSYVADEFIDGAHKWSWDEETAKEFFRPVKASHNPQADHEMSNMIGEAKTVGDITIDNGKILFKGKAAGEVMQDLKHGYHPAIRLTINGKTTWFEQDTPNLIDAIFNKAQDILGQNVDEGYGGWDEPEPRQRERDPDDAYDRMRQDKLDAEVDKLPTKNTYQCSGRGPNNEPNYTFGPEFATQEEAIAYRKELMADPSTPNPRDIGIRTIRRQVQEESAYAPDEELADLSKIRTDKLQQLHALHRHYGQTNPRSKESAQRGAAELKKRGIVVPTDESVAVIGANSNSSLADHYRKQRHQPQEEQESLMDLLRDAWNVVTGKSNDVEEGSNMQSRLDNLAGNAEQLDELNVTARKVPAGATNDVVHNGWNIRYQVKPKEGSTEYLGLAKHLKSDKTPPIKATGTSAEDVVSKLKQMIATNKGNAEITASSVTVDFNVLVTRDIIGHSDELYADIVNHDGKILLLISSDNHGGMQKAQDRRSLAARTRETTGQHAFGFSGKKARSVGLTHARYTLGNPVNYMPGVSAYELEFNSEVHPGESIRLSSPGVTIAYPKNSTVSRMEAHEAVESYVMAEDKFQAIRDAYASIERIDPSSPAYEQLIARLDTMDRATLQQFADAKIKFISGLAMNRLRRMGK